MGLEDLQLRRVEEADVEFPVKFKKLNLSLCSDFYIQEFFKSQQNRIVLLSDDSCHSDGEYYSAIVRDGGDGKHYYAALLEDQDIIKEDKFSYKDLAGLLIGEGRALFKKEYKVLRIVTDFIEKR